MSRLDGTCNRVFKGRVSLCLMRKECLSGGGTHHVKILPDMSFPRRLFHYMNLDFPFFFFFFPTFNCDECIILEIWQVEVSYPGWPRWEYLGVWTNLPLWFNFIVQILVCSSPTSNLGGKQFLSCGDSIGWFLTCFSCNFCALLCKPAVSCQFCIINGGVPDSFSRKEKPQITGFMRFTCILFPGFLKVNSIKLLCESVRSMLLFLTSFINERLC